MNLLNELGQFKKPQLDDFIEALNSAKDAACGINVANLIDKIQMAAVGIRDAPPYWTWRMLRSRDDRLGLPKHYMLDDGEPDPFDPSKKVHWIKWYRERSGAELLESKRTIEWIVDVARPAVLNPGSATYIWADGMSPKPVEPKEPPTKLERIW